MTINEEKFNDLQLETRTNTGAISNIVERMDSYHHDTRQRFDKIDILLAALPTESQIYRMFSEEGQKLAAGLIKKDEEQDVKINDIKEEMAVIKTNQKWYTMGFGFIGTFIGGLLDRCL